MCTSQQQEEEVFIVRLGTGGAEEERVPSCYTQLKSSSTLLVPLELVEDPGQALIHQAQTVLTTLVHGVEPEGPTSGAQGFSLMLEEDEDVDPDADTLPLETGVGPSHAADALAQPEVLFLGTEELQRPLEGQETDMVTLERMEDVCEEAEAVVETEAVKEAGREGEA